MATFTTWPHTSPTPQPQDLAAAGFLYYPRPTGSLSFPDNVKCTICQLNLNEWEPNDDPVYEHITHSPHCSVALEVQAQAREQAQIRALEASKPAIKSPQDLGFFDPSLGHDFPEMCLYHDVNLFISHIKECKDQYRQESVLQVLPKCLRGSAFDWCRDLPETSDLRGPSKTLEMWLSALESVFKKETPVQSKEAPKSPQQMPPQVPIEYHKCAACSASFSSLSRLLSHSQTAGCNRATCKHCEKKFESKNKLHNHIRECLPASKSEIPSKSALVPLISPESSPEKSRSSTRSSITRESPTPTPLPAPLQKASPATPKFATPSLASAETPISPLPEYRAISPSPPTYKPRTYLTVDDLYMRYAPLKSIKRSTRTRPVTVLPTLTVKDLYKRFEKRTEKPHSSIAKYAAKSRGYPAKSTASTPANQNTARSRSRHPVLDLKSSIKSLGKKKENTVLAHAKPQPKFSDILQHPGPMTRCFFGHYSINPSSNLFILETLGR